MLERDFESKTFPSIFILKRRFFNEAPSAQKWHHWSPAYSLLHFFERKHFQLANAT